MATLTNDKIVEVNSGKCLTGFNFTHADGVRSIVLRDCDVTQDANQIIRVWGVDSSDGSKRFSLQDRYLTNYWGWLDLHHNEDGKWGDMRMPSGGSMTTDPFQINNAGNGASLGIKGEHVKFHEPNATFIIGKHAKYCKDYGIPLTECYRGNREDCGKYENWKRDDCKPQVCPKADGSYLDKPECKLWCKQNPGKCDIAASKWCQNHPDNKTFCGCYNIDKFGNAKLDQMLLKPQCYLNQCAGGLDAYKTAEFHTPNNCIPFTICSADINQTAGGSASVKDTVIIQNCGNDEEKEKNSTSKTPTGSAIKSFLVNKWTDAESFLVKNKWTVGAGAATCFVFLLFILFMIVMME